MSEALPCPFCSCPISVVKDSRPTQNTIRRRRKCMSCDKRFTTHELILEEYSALMSGQRVRLTPELVTLLAPHINRLVAERLHALTDRGAAMPVLWLGRYP